MKVNTFTDLVAWREAHALVLLIYKSTKSFPADEKFGLASQMRRAAISTTSNISEGFCRRTKNDKNQFYLIAKGSNAELQSQLFASRDLEYLTTPEFRTIYLKSVGVSKLISGLIKSSATAEKY